MNRRRQARLIRQAEERLRDDMWRADDADAYGHRIVRTPAQIAEANRQWDAIPETAAEIAIWMKRPPINGESA